MQDAVIDANINYDGQRSDSNVWSLYRRASERFDADLGAISDTLPRRRAIATAHDLQLSTFSRKNIDGSVLSDSDIQNIICGPKDNPDTIIAADYAKKYHRVRKENEALKATVKAQEAEIHKYHDEIRKLKATVQSLQSDLDTSESRYERTTSTSTNNSLPVVRVTPQKRQFKQRSPRSPHMTPSTTPRRSAARRLDISNISIDRTPLAHSTPVLRPTPDVNPSRHCFSEPRITRVKQSRQAREASPPRTTYPRSRQILRDAGLETDILGSSTSSFSLGEQSLRPLSDDSTPTPTRERASIRAKSDTDTRYVRPIIPTRSISTSASNTPVRNASSADLKTPISQRLNDIHNSRQTIIVRGRNAGAMHPKFNEVIRPEWECNAENSPGYHLRLKRPEFIEHIERRQYAIRLAAQKRAHLEENRKEAVRAIASGQVGLEDVAHIVFADATSIHAFPNKEMKELTKRRLSGTNEVLTGIREQEKKRDQAVHRIMSICYSANTQRKLRRSRSRSLNSLVRI